MDDSFARWSRKIQERCVASNVPITLVQAILNDVVVGRTRIVCFVLDGFVARVAFRNHGVFPFI